ncbi:sugar phosphate isomerase/epimerase family protein [Agromyces aerolatus]|uniref:sugar phosphate isomerase/epimerase family protein n=1 Tax=Agromyces sp. LY-1074 TaxID=3074080 RepID=UPI002855F649|nr:MULTISPECIES: TIM barrel protein [unclassified Agromyces]MDR5699102.1 TIM barrel protein [Agromyces sp. LY-1074]MDR5705119.1 TIM barrel protein [Agromyces sp. LY-1358]
MIRTAAANPVRIGLEGFTFPDLDAFALVDLAAGARYAFAGVRLVDPATNTPTLPADQAHRLREHAIRRGITLFGADLVDLEGPRDGWADVFAVLAAAGVTRFSAIHRGADLRAASRRFAELVARAREYGLTPHLEPVSYFGIDSIGTVADLVAHAGGGGLTLDTLHFGRRGDDLDRLAELAAGTPVWLQVCDAPALDELVPAGATADERLAALRHESIAARLAPGAGVCDVAAIVRTVRDAAPFRELVVMVEVPDHERVRRIGASAHAVACRDAADALIARVTVPEERP